MNNTSANLQTSLPTNVLFTLSVFLDTVVNSSTWSSGAEDIWSSGKNSRYVTLIGTHQPIMQRHKTLNFFASVVLFSNTQIALPSMGLLAPDHLRQDICSPYRHQPHHRLIRIFGWMDSYAVLAAALCFIPSFWSFHWSIIYTVVLEQQSWISSNIYWS